MRIEVILTESEIAEEFSEGLEARDLPEKLFYWFPLSVRAWRALAQDSVHEGFRACWSRLAANIGGITEHFGAPVPVISFGAGDGTKDCALMRVLKEAGREVKYFPVDASQALLETACAAAEDSDIETTGIKADISSPVHLVFAADAAESPKLFLISGNTLGAFDPLDQIRHLAGCMHPGDRLILDGEIYSEGSLTRRDAPAMRRFAMAPLASVGITPEDGSLKFDLRRDERHEGLYMITRSFNANRDLRASISGREIPVERGERIAMNFQYAYTPETFRWLIEKHGGLQILSAVPSPDGHFVAAVCSR